MAEPSQASHNSGLTAAAGSSNPPVYPHHQALVGQPPALFAAMQMAPNAAISGWHVVPGNANLMPVVCAPPPRGVLIPAGMAAPQFAQHIVLGHHVSAGATQPRPAFETSPPNSSDKAHVAPHSAPHASQQQQQQQTVMVGTKRHHSLNDHQRGEGAAHGANAAPSPLSPSARLPKECSASAQAIGGGSGSSGAALAGGRQGTQSGATREGGSSRFHGVTWYKASKRWQARLCTGRRQYHLGYFKEEDEAARAYDRAMIQAQGLKATQLNFADEAAAVVAALTAANVPIGVGMLSLPTAAGPSSTEHSPRDRREAPTPAQHQHQQPPRPGFVGNGHPPVHGPLTGTANGGQVADKGLDRPSGGGGSSSGLHTAGHGMLLAAAALAHAAEMGAGCGASADAAGSDGVNGGVVSGQQHSDSADAASMAMDTQPAPPPPQQQQQQLHEVQSQRLQPPQPQQFHTVMLQKAPPRPMHDTPLLVQYQPQPAYVPPAGAHRPGQRLRLGLQALSKASLPYSDDGSSHEPPTIDHRFPPEPRSLQYEYPLTEPGSMQHAARVPEPRSMQFQLPQQQQQQHAPSPPAYRVAGPGPGPGPGLGHADGGLAHMSEPAVAWAPAHSMATGAGFASVEVARAVARAAAAAQGGREALAAWEAAEQQQRQLFGTAAATRAASLHCTRNGSESAAAGMVPAASATSGGTEDIVVEMVARPAVQGFLADSGHMLAAGTGGSVQLYEHEWDGSRLVLRNVLVGLVSTSGELTNTSTSSLPLSADTPMQLVGLASPGLAHHVASAATNPGGMVEGPGSAVSAAAVASPHSAPDVRVVTSVAAAALLGTGRLPLGAPLGVQQLLPAALPFAAQHLDSGLEPGALLASPVTKLPVVRAAGDGSDAEAMDLDKEPAGGCALPRP